MNKLDYFLTLNAISGLGHTRIKKLFEKFGSARNILTASVSELTADKMIPHNIAEGITQGHKAIDLKKEYDLIKKHNVRLITYQDSEYPDNLKDIPDFPLILYVKGTLQKTDNLSVAIVGSRRASLYGTTMAEKFARELAELGITIVSGMARGIDSAAHRGALKAKGRTIAVFGCGLSVVYPPENKALFDEMAQRGAILSEFPMEMPPLAFNFPRRNRIISGLSLGVVVAEASRKSGALITSDFALEQGREVFAVPGKVDSPNTPGVHQLIKQGAKLVSNIEDILEELKPHLKNRLKENKEKEQSSKEISVARDIGHLTQEEVRLYRDIDEEGIHIDELAQRNGFSISQTMNILLNLEIKRKIRQLPGKLFVRLSQS